MTNQEINQNIYQRVSSLVAKKLSINEDSIKPEATLDSLGADSVDKVEFVIEVEEEFSVEISDKESDRLSTIQDYVNLIASKIG